MFITVIQVVLLTEPSYRRDSRRLRTVNCFALLPTTMIRDSKWSPGNFSGTAHFFSVLACGNEANSFGVVETMIIFRPAAGISRLTVGVSSTGDMANGNWGGGFGFYLPMTGRPLICARDRELVYNLFLIAWPEAACWRKCGDLVIRSWNQLLFYIRSQCPGWRVWAYWHSW